MKIESNLTTAINHPLRYEMVDINKLFYTNHLQISHIIVLCLQLCSKNCTLAIYNNIKDVLYKVISLLPKHELVVLAPGIISKTTKLLMTFKDKSILYPSLEYVILQAVHDIDTLRLAEYLQYLPFQLDMSNLLGVIFQVNQPALIKSVANAFLYNIYDFNVQCPELLPILYPKINDNIILIINLHYLQIYQNHDLLLSLCNAAKYAPHVMKIVPLSTIQLYISKDPSILEYLQPFLNLQECLPYLNDLYWKSLAVTINTNFMGDSILYDALKLNHTCALSNISNNFNLSIPQLILSNFDYLVDKSCLMIPNTDAIHVISNSLQLLQSESFKINKLEIAMLMQDTVESCFDVLETLPKDNLITDVGILLYRYVILMKEDAKNEIQTEIKNMPNLKEWLQMRLPKSADAVVYHEEEQEASDYTQILAIYKIAIHFISHANLNIKAIYLSILYNCLVIIKHHKMFLNCVHLVWDQLLTNLTNESDAVVFYILKMISRICEFATDFITSRFDGFYDNLERTLLFYITNKQKNEKLVEIAVGCFICFIKYCKLTKIQMRKLKSLGIERLTQEVDVVLKEEAFVHAIVQSKVAV